MWGMRLVDKSWNARFSWKLDEDASEYRTSWGSPSQHRHHCAYVMSLKLNSTPLVDFSFNDNQHTSTSSDAAVSIRIWFESSNIENLYRPSLSHDGNWTEPLLEDLEVLECHWSATVNRGKSNTELTLSLKEEWCSIMPEIYQSLL